MFQDLCTARTLRQRRLGSAVASRGRHSACPARRVRDTVPTAHTWAARRAPSASGGRGGQSRRAGGTARARPAAIATAGQTVPPRLRRTAGGIHQRRLERAVVSRGWHSAWSARRDRDEPPMANGGTNNISPTYDREAQALHSLIELEAERCRPDSLGDGPAGPHLRATVAGPARGVARLTRLCSLVAYGQSQVLRCAGTLEVRSGKCLPST